MSELVEQMTLAEVAQLVGGTLEGDGDAVISGVESIKRARKKHVSFFSTKSANTTMIEDCKAGCLLAEPDCQKPAKVGAMIYVHNPSAAFTEVYKRFLPAPPVPEPGIHPTAVIAQSAQIGSNASIGPYAVVGEHVVIGDDAVLHPHAVIMYGARVGDRFRAYPHSVVREYVLIGDDVLIQSGAVIGTEGFGYVLNEGDLQIVPQLGTVALEDRVHVGANSTVDRARFGKTRVGAGSKIDNLVQVGHNVHIGVACGIAAQTGIAGSCEIGDFCDITGQVGIGRGVQIGAGTRLYARAGVIQDVEAGSELYDFPAVTQRVFFKRMAMEPKLFDALKVIKKINRRVEQLEQASGEASA